MAPANDVFMRVWFAGKDEPSTFVFAAAAYMRFETDYYGWRNGRSPGRPWAVMVGEDGSDTTVQFSDIVVRQMTTREEYEKDPESAFQTLEELTADYVKVLRREGVR